MPIFNLKVLTNDGAGTYLDMDVDPSGGTVTVASNGLTNIAQDATPTVGEGATYDAEDERLTLPITILGFATTANKTTADYAVGDTLTLSSGSQTIYAVPSTSRLSVDVSTLAGWDALAAGAHDITIVAKASGFKDSAPSAAVQVTKAASTKTLAAGTYKWKDYVSTYISNGTMQLSFSSNSETFTKMNFVSGEGGLIYYAKADGTSIFAYGDDQGWSATNIAYQTIILSSEQEVSQEFYDNYITTGALVKQATKGDIITIEDKQYRILKMNGTVAEVLAMYDASATQEFNADESQTYENSSLDTYCNTTFYNSLSSAMQNGIVAKTFQQDSWYWSSGTSGGSGNPIYQGTYQTTNNYRLGLSNAAFGSSISRKCYVLSVQDVIDYFGVTTSMGSADTTLTSENVWKMFWNQTTSPGSTYPWLRSALAEESARAFRVVGANGGFYSSVVYVSSAVRPAFQIDLSKISWSK